jgi:hypothetical protein
MNRGIKKPEAIKLINYSELKLSQDIGFRAIQIYNIIYYNGYKSAIIL